MIPVICAGLGVQSAALARMVGAGLQQRYGQAVVVLDKPGAALAHHVCRLVAAKAIN